jgi:hypothetical protein
MFRRASVSQVPIRRDGLARPVINRGAIPNLSEAADSRAESFKTEECMAKAHYEIVEHDGGWAYRMQGSFSETFPTKAAAEAAANRAAAEQKVPGEAEDIEFEDSKGKWHIQRSAGDDRPDTDVS